MPWSTSRGRKRLMLPMRLRWNAHILHNAMTWLSLVFPLSMNTPRFLTDTLGFTSASPTLLQNSPYLARLCFDWTKIYSVLDGFNLNLFINIHALTSAMHFSIWEIVRSLSPGLDGSKIINIIIIIKILRLVYVQLPPAMGHASLFSLFAFMSKSIKNNTSVRYVAKTNNKHFCKYIESFCILYKLSEDKKHLKNSDTFPSHSPMINFTIERVVYK